MPLIHRLPLGIPMLLLVLALPFLLCFTIFLISSLLLVPTVLLIILLLVLFLFPFLSLPGLALPMEILFTFRWYRLRGGRSGHLCGTVAVLLVFIFKLSNGLDHPIFIITTFVLVIFLGVLILASFLLF